MAMFLGKMKEVAESNLNRVVDDCVISCPVFYGEEQRRALLDASVIAGLKPLQIMSETTAAALAYGIYKQDLPDEGAPARNVVFVDFGFNSLQVLSPFTTVVSSLITVGYHGQFQQRKIDNFGLSMGRYPGRFFV